MSNIPELNDLIAFGQDFFDPVSAVKKVEGIIDAIRNQVEDTTYPHADFDNDLLQDFLDKGYTIIDNSISNPLNLTYTISGWGNVFP